MTHVFADTGYWIALLSLRDEFHDRAQEISETLGDAKIVTSDGVFTELLNSFAEHGPHMRFVASTAVTVLKKNPNVIVLPQTQELFAKAFNLYCERTDKGWS